MQAERTISHDHSMWLEVEQLCRRAIDLAGNVQLSIREYPGLNLAGGYLSWVLLHELTTHGAVSISDLVELRPASREWIRRLVGELVATDLAEFLPNPNRRKSKLVQITSRGAIRYKEISDELDSFAHGLTLTPEQVVQAADVISQINDALAAVMEARRRSSHYAATEEKS